MKIAISSPLASSSRPQYGTETVVRNLALALTEKQHHVDLLVHPTGEEPSEIDWLSDSMRAIKIEGRHKHSLARALARYAHDQHPDAILAIARRDNLALCWAKRHLPSGMPAVISEHSAITDSLREYNPVKRWARLRMMRRAYQRADAIVAVSQGIAAEVHDQLHIASDRAEVIYNPIVSDRLRRLANEPVAHPWFREGQPPVIVAVGRLDPHKDFATLLRAFAELRQAQPSRLVIIGEGAERSQLQHLANELQITDDLDMPGFMANPLPYIRRGAVLALSSLFEGFGNVLVEALASETPVVATDCPHGPSEILDNGRYGTLVPVGDHGSLARAIVSTITQPPPGSMLKDRAAVFSANHAARRYIGLFEQIHTALLADG